MKTSALILCAAIGVGTTVVAGDDLLRDPGFESLNGKSIGREAVAGAWSIPPGAPYVDGIEVKAAAAAAHGGKTGLRLQQVSSGRLAAVHQPIPQLAAGIYEFKVWAKGKGVLVLKTDALRRRGDLTNGWAEYSLTFAQAKAGPADLAILVNGNAQVDDTSLAPAAADRVAAWKEQEKARAEYGFVPEYFAAQSPQPGAPVKPVGTFHGGPVTWREKVVFYDKHYDACNINPEPIARYLGANGFQVLEAAPFGEWMKKAIREGAYGTVCVLPHGLCPGSVFTKGATWDDPKSKESLIAKYLEAGGRVVWIGDVPLNYMQDDVHPQVFSTGAMSVVLGVRGGWEHACWNSKGEPQITVLGKAWGLADAGGAIIAAYPEDITAALSGFHSDYADSDLAVYWFKNFSPRHPWSGFIRSSGDLASVYRVALYAGQPVEAPAVTNVATEAAAPLKVVLDPPRNRHCYYRGEKIPVRLEVGAGVLEGALHLSLVRNGKSFPAGECSRSTKEAPTQAEIPTADLACGDYQLQVQSAVAGKETVVGETTVSLCPRHDDPTFFFGVSGAGGGSVPYRQEMIIKDVASHGVQPGTVTTDMPTSSIDLMMKYGLRFALRAHGIANLTPQEREEALIRGPAGEKIPGAWEGGRPITGLFSPKVRQTAAADMAKQVKELAAWPSAWLRCQTCDDFQIYYGWDYSDLAKRAFKEKTGLDAPVPPEVAKLGSGFRSAGAIGRAPGIVPDNDPWLQWSIFTTKDIGGGYNKALMDACAAAVPGIKVGPVPGASMFGLWYPGQYPPHDFGQGGFNMLDYYMYLQYWSPTVANLYWNEIGRINNRDLEAWSEPDCCSRLSPAYYINTFFLQVAGGCQGLTYYAYAEASPVAWETLGKIGNTIVKPLYPFLGKLRPARTSVGLLLPYTQYCYTPYYAVSALYPYANLLGAHVDVQPTCEEEVLDGDAARYKVLLLWRVQYLRQSVVTALEDYIAKGGVVICDATTQVPIKGAIKSPVDLAMGNGKSNPDPNDPRLGGPGITDYLHPDRVALVRKTLQPYAPPWADCADPTLIARRHEYRGVTYLWLVNVESQAEYEYFRPRAAGGPANSEQQKREYAAYLAERVDGQRFQPRVTIPAGNWAAYDVLKGQRVPLQKQGNRLAFTADMERLGGSLIALYPEPVKGVRVTITTKDYRSHWLGFGGARISRGRSATLRVTVRGRSGKPLSGTQPLAVTVLTPQGEWAEITGAHATDDGVWFTTVHPAINDPAGTWKVRVKELSSGITGETAFEVNSDTRSATGAPPVAAGFSLRSR